MGEGGPSKQLYGSIDIIFLDLKAITKVGQASAKWNALKTLTQKTQTEDVKTLYATQNSEKWWCPMKGKYEKPLQ